MIKNIYKSYITSVIGALFLLADIAYFLLKDANLKILVGVAFIGVCLIFLNEGGATKLINKVINRLTR